MARISNWRHFLESLTGKELSQLREGALAEFQHMQSEINRLKLELGKEASLVDLYAQKADERESARVAAERRATDAEASESALMDRVGEMEAELRATRNRFEIHYTSIEMLYLQVNLNVQIQVQQPPAASGNDLERVIELVDSRLDEEVK